MTSPEWAKYQTITLDIPNDVINQIVDYASTRDNSNKSVVITELIQAGLNNNLHSLIGTKQSSDIGNEIANEIVVNELQHLIKIKDAHGLKSMWVVYELYRICRNLIGDIELREIAKSLDFGYLWLKNAWETLPERVKRSEKDDIPF